MITSRWTIPAGRAVSGASAPTPVASLGAGFGTGLVAGDKQVLAVVGVADLEGKYTSHPCN